MLTVVESAPLPSSDLADLVAQASAFADAARADTTRRAYRSDLAHFEAWCHGHGLIAMPSSPATVGIYLTAHAGHLAISTLTRRLSAIASAHRLAGHMLDTKHPAIRDTFRGMKRAKGSAPRRAAPLTVQAIKRVTGTCGTRRLDLRDRALLLFGTAGALRRSELVALDVSDISETAQGLRVAIRRSKGDQIGEGELVQIGRTGRETCPVAALQAWLDEAGIDKGPLFRSVDRHGNIGLALSTRAVALIVQRRAHLAGMEASSFSGHSMRAGFATAAAAAGIEERLIAKQTRHKSMTVLRGYIREGELFATNLAADIGL